MKEGGWNLNILQAPACVHLCCTMLHAQSGVADRFINDVKVAVKKVNIYSSPFRAIFEDLKILAIMIGSKLLFSNFPFLSCSMIRPLANQKPPLFMVLRPAFPIEVLLTGLSGLILIPFMSQNLPRRRSQNVMGSKMEI